MIYSMGEVLIDFMQEGETFVPYPGGAPANVATHARRSGVDAVFIGKISTDSFGDILQDFLQSNQIYFPLHKSSKNTTLAIVTHKDGDRQFQFYRTNTADLDLDHDDIETIQFKSKDILHICSLGLVNEGSTRKAHHYAIEKAKSVGAYISFDVNLREKLWDNLDTAYTNISQLLPLADIIKVNETELEWLTTSGDSISRMRELQSNKQLIICTLGPDGSIILKPDGTHLRYNPPRVKQLDTTGAGDSYIAMILSSLSQSSLDFEKWIENDLESAIEQASFVSAQVVQKQGAVPIIEYKK